MTPLCELARKYGTDKGGEHYIAGDTCHAYTPVYHAMFHERTEAITDVLEIGINYGCSLRMWKDYFPNAKIVGLDSNGETLREYGARIIPLAADQNNGASLDNALLIAAGQGAGTNGYDVIVDDGSHEFEHQVFSAKHLLPRLKKDGLYIIEDIHDDCHPEVVADRIMADPMISEAFEVMFVSCPTGLGRAHCWCSPGCMKPETLIVFRWKP